VRREVRAACHGAAPRGRGHAQPDCVIAERPFASRWVGSRSCSIDPAIGRYPGRPANIDLYISAIHPTEPFKDVYERGYMGLPRKVALIKTYKHADPPELFGPLLRSCHQRPSRRAAEPCNKFPPYHLITSSAMASRLGGIVRPDALAVLRLIARWNLVRYCTAQVGDPGAAQQIGPNKTIEHALSAAIVIWRGSR
jgi:hypothetical protein